LIFRRLIVLLMVAVVSAAGGEALAQSAFPAPLPGQAPPANDPAFPPVNGAVPRASIGVPASSFPVTGAAPLAGGGGGFERPQAPGPGAADEECRTGFLPLRQEAERRGKMIQAASQRHAAPEEACKLIGNFSQAEIKMIKFVEGHLAKCGIPQQVPEQLKNSHRNTEKMQQKVCDAAQQQQKGPTGPSLSDVLGSAAALPEATATAKKGGSTFDTLNGNVLTR
jgi:hypothetical protein